MPRFVIPKSLPESLATRRWLAPILFAVLATALALVARRTYPFSIGVQRLNNTLYDSFYQFRRSPNVRGGNVLIVTVDQKSLGEAHVIDETTDPPGRIPRGWPWPRGFWAAAIDVVAEQKPRAIAFDLLFTEPSVLNRYTGDDRELAQSIDGAEVPLVFASVIGEDGAPGPFAPPAEAPVFGGVNVLQAGDDKSRFYSPVVNGRNSLANETLRRAGLKGAGELPQRPFRLFYYGPHQRAPGDFTFDYISAWNVVAAAMHPDKASDFGITPDLFKDKIVLVGSTAPALLDLGPTPLDDKSPRVELHATAIENILRGDRAVGAGPVLIFLTTLGSALAASFAAALPRRMSSKLVLSGLVLAALVGTSLVLFLGETVHWLPIAASLLATLSTVIFSLGWSFGVEDKQSRFFLKALGQSVSPEVADEIRRNPEKLDYHLQRRNTTVLFSDIAGFTDMSEALELEQLNQVLRLYLDELSAIVRSTNGTLDKYIGDAIMAFWNAPLDQADHAALACGTALRMIRRENEIRPRLAELGAPNLFTRIGLNTGDVAVGNLGSSIKFAYTVIGDAVNLGARLEGSNKLYGTQICVSHNTAELVKDRFLLRQLDVLRVKGKKKPMAVYELICEGTGTAEQRNIVDRYQRAFRSYQSQEWDEAERLLLEILVEHPKDGPSQALLQRIAKFRHDAPAPDWDGVYVAKDK